VLRLEQATLARGGDGLGATRGVQLAVDAACVRPDGVAIISASSKFAQGFATTVQVAANAHQPNEAVSDLEPSPVATREGEGPIERRFRCGQFIALLEHRTAGEVKLVADPTLS